MTKDDFETLLKDLENKACMPKMSHFGNDSYFQCPWLRWQLGRLSKLDKIKGILIMQDWDCKPQSFDDATKFIETQFGENHGSDKTTNNLFRSNKWKCHIGAGKILVTNSVWGIRPPKSNGTPSNMCGYLGVEIHKTAFLTWGKLVSIISRSETTDKDFRLFLAGEWARFDNQKNKSGEAISAYLKRTRSWSLKNLGNIKETEIPDLWAEDKIEACKGQVIFLSHPCTWHSNFEEDPFADV